MDWVSSVTGIRGPPTSTGHGGQRLLGSRVAGFRQGIGHLFTTQQRVGITRDCHQGPRFQRGPQLRFLLTLDSEGFNGAQAFA